MENSYISTFRTLVVLIVFAIGAAVILAALGRLDDALMVLLGSVITGCFARMDHQSPKSVTIDNKPNDPVPVASDNGVA